MKLFAIWNVQLLAILSMLIIHVLVVLLLVLLAAQQMYVCLVLIITIWKERNVWHLALLIRCFLMLPH